MHDKGMDNQMSQDTIITSKQSISDSLLMSLGAIDTARILQNDYVTGMVHQKEISHEDPY